MVADSGDEPDYSGPDDSGCLIRWALRTLPVIAIVVALGVAFFAGGSSQAPRVAVMIPGSVRFFDVQLEAMHEQAQAHGIDVVVFNADWSPQVQLDQVESAFDKDFQVVAVAAADTSVVSEAIRLDRGQAELLIFTNAITEDPKGVVDGTAGYIGRDEFAAGRLLGDQAMAAADESSISAPRVLLIAGAPGTAPQQLRTSGYLAAVSARDHWPDPVEVTIAGWDLSLVEAELARLLRDDSFDLIATQWADAAVVASRFAEASGAQVPIVSLEWTETLAQTATAGHIRSSTHFSVADEGRAVIEAAARLIDGDPDHVLVTIDQRIVRSDQADSVSADW